MTDAPLTQHLTFTVERVYDAPRERVFSAFANVDEKAKWFGGPEGQWKPLIREMDFRRGGHERAKGQWFDVEGQLAVHAAVGADHWPGHDSATRDEPV